MYQLIDTAAAAAAAPAAALSYAFLAAGRPARSAAPLMAPNTWMNTC